MQMARITPTMTKAIIIFLSLLAYAQAGVVERNHLEVYHKQPINHKYRIVANENNPQKNEKFQNNHHQLSNPVHTIKPNDKHEEPSRGYIKLKLNTYQQPIGYSFDYDKYVKQYIREPTLREYQNHRHSIVDDNGEAHKQTVEKSPKKFYGFLKTEDSNKFSYLKSPQPKYYVQDYKPIAYKNNNVDDYIAYPPYPHIPQCIAN